MRDEEQGERLGGRERGEILTIFQNDSSQVSKHNLKLPSKHFNNSNQPLSLLQQGQHPNPFFRIVLIFHHSVSLIPSSPPPASSVCRALQIGRRFCLISVAVSYRTISLGSLKTILSQLSNLRLDDGEWGEASEGPSCGDKPQRVHLVGISLRGSTLWG